MRWDVRASGDGVPILSTNLAQSSDGAWLLFIGDVHWDNARSDRHALKRILDEAVQRDAAIIDLGDWFDAMQGVSDRRAAKEALRSEHGRNDYFSALVDTSAEWLLPYADRIAVMLTGNHETAVVKHHEIDLTKIHTDKLRAAGSPVVYAGYENYALIRLVYGQTQRTTIPMWLEHGYGGGGEVTKGVIQAQRRAAKYPDAQFVVSGHIHSSYYVAHEQFRVNNAGTTWETEQEHYVCNTFKDEFKKGRGGYHVEKGRGPRLPSGWWCRLYVRNRRYYWDFTRAK